ncbi:MAG: serine hydrolase domain-containing protein [Reyranella sp.]
MTSSAAAEEAWRRLVRKEIHDLVPANRAGGVAVAILVDGRTLFFCDGFADLARDRPVTPDSLFNLASLRKVFEAIVLAEAVEARRMAFDDPVAKYIPELGRGRDIRRVTVGQLAIHTSGLLLPPDQPPWPTEHYSLASFFGALNEWQADKGHEPGRQHMYTHAGYVLLQLALERGLGAPIGELVARRILDPLGMKSSLIPMRGSDGRGELPAALKERAVQGYAADGQAIGVPGDQQTYYDFPGTGQMFSSARDLAAFLSANMGLSASRGEPSPPPALAKAMRAARKPAIAIARHHAQALAWEVNDTGSPSIIEKNGGLNNSSTYMGLVPSRKLGVIVLTNRGDQNVAEIGQRILRALANRRS